jgi:CRISPR/Cas system CSM-associated protein Csm3 (group 7 of RAMP superfamily)
MPHRLHLELEIPFITRWHTGSGEGSFTTDRLVRRNARNQPFIPGSTLKGVIRQSCEKLNRTLGFPPPWDPHRLDLSGREGGLPPIQMECPVDQIFGTRVGCGELYFRDAVPKPFETDLCKTYARNQVARYRVLRTSRDQHLFNTECVPPLTLYTQIDAWHPLLPCFDAGDLPYAYCMLIGGILAVDRLGAQKSSGAGWLDGSIHITAVEYNGNPYRIDEALDFLQPEFYRDSKGLV